jgi:hypothetical protein
VREFYGSQAFEVVKNPDVVWATLLNDNVNGKIKERVRRVKLSPEFQKRASEILTSNKTYGWNIAKPCLPQYGARFVFQKGSATVPIDFCFDCDILIASTSPDRSVSEDFDSEEDNLIKIFQATFPKDRTIKSVQ